MKIELDHRDCDEIELKAQFDLRGASKSLLLNGAVVMVIKWLKDNGLPLTMTFDNQADDAQGRVWTDIYLVAQWE